MRLFACCLLLIGLLLGLADAIGEAPRVQAWVEADVLELGEDLYGRRCSVCHGPTGLGLEEARLAFPESHRRCTQCHKSGGTKILTYPFQDNNMFDVGLAPALRGEGTLAPLSDPQALRAYIQAAMPRHAPGTLTAAETDAVAAFVEGLNKQRAMSNEP